MEPCGHAFCKGSYKEFFEYQIKQSGKGYKLICPQEGCKKEVPDTFLKKVVD